MADKETLPIDYTKYKGLSSRRAHKTLRGAIRKLLRDEQAKYKNYSHLFARYWFSRPITWLYILTCGLLLTYYFFADPAEQIRTIVEFCLVSTFFILNSLLTYFNKLALCVGRIRRARAHLKAFKPERDPLLTMSQDEMARQASNSACDYQRVRRDGQWQLLPAALLVEGDLVLLAVNQHAPARVTSLHYSGELVTAEPFHTPSSPPSADHVGRDWSPWRVLETPVLRTLAGTFAAGPDLPLELIPPALSRALWLCGLTSLAVSVIHSVVRVAVLEHQRVLWPWLFMQRNAFLLLPILGITVPALEWIITCLQNARLWALFHTQQQTPVTLAAQDEEHVLKIDHEPSAKYEEVPGALVRDYFDHFMRGDSSVLSRYSRLIHVLGHATTLCVIDKEGILSETIPYPEKLCVFNDEESVVLALERQQRNSIRFVSENWEEYLPALKPLGLNTMLNSSCKSRARQHRDRALDSPSHVLDHVPFISEHNKCLYLLGREIGFTEAVIENYIHLNETHIYQTHAAHHRPGQGLNGGNSIDSQYQSIIALLVQDIASESLQLLSRGSPEFVLDVCQQYWNGESLNRMNDQIRTSITRLYTQWGVNVDYHCICFSYKPIDRRFKMLFKERGVLLSSEIGQSAVVDESESSGTTIGTRKSSEIKKRNKKLKIEAIKNKRKEKTKKGTSSSFDVFGLKKKSRDKKKKDRGGDVSEPDEARDQANNSTASPRDSASEGPDEREGCESESRDQVHDQQSRDQHDKSASDSVPPDHVTDQHEDSASTPRALPRIDEEESSEHVIDPETSAEQLAEMSREQLMEASASRVIDESSRMETEFTEREDESDLTASYKQALYDQTLLGMAAVRYLPRDSMPQLIEELMDASIRFVYFSRVNEQRTKLFADKLGLETDWNCCISLQEQAVPPGPSSEVAPTSPGSAIEKLPHGIEKIKRHIREVDNVPLLVKMFSDATPQNTMEMIDILQQNGEVCVVLGSALQLQHQNAFMAAGKSIFRTLRHVTNSHADLSFSLMPERVSDCSGDTEPDHTPRDPIDTSRADSLGDRAGDTRVPFTYSSVSSTQFKEHKTSGTLAVDLNSLPCDLIFKSDTNLFDIYELFRAGRHLLSNTTQALLLLLGAHLALHYLMLISALVYVPPVLNGIHLLWLLVVITPLLSLCLLWAPLEPKIMKQIAPKNLPIKTRRLFRYLGYFVARAIPSVLVCVVIYIWVLQLTWTTFDTRVIYGTELPVDFDWTNYFQALHFAQNVTLYAFVLYLVVTSLTCHHRNLSLKVVNPFMNKPWVIGVPIILVLQTAFFVISLRGDLSLLSLITWPVWVILFGWMPLLIATHEGIKRIDLNDYIRQQTIMKLEFNTKLGMHSPI